MRGAREGVMGPELVVRPALQATTHLHHLMHRRQLRSCNYCLKIILLTVQFSLVPGMGLEMRLVQLI